MNGDLQIRKEKGYIGGSFGDFGSIVFEGTLGKKPVAVKIIPKSYNPHAETSVFPSHRFRTELNHVNLVKLYGVCEDSR